MLLNELALGKSIELHVEREGYHYRLVSKIEDVADDHICITLIATKNRVFRFLTTDKVSFIYKADTRLYIWKNVIGDIISLDGENVHCLYAPNEGESYNRRNAYRVFLGEEIEIDYIPFTQEMFDLEEEKVPEKCPALIKDISENGVGIFTNRTMSIKDQIAFELATPFGLISCTAEVTREASEVSGIYRKFYGCTFNRVSKNITKFIFDMQRKQISMDRKFRS